MSADNEDEVRWRKKDLDDARARRQESETLGLIHRLNSIPEYSDEKKKRIVSNFRKGLEACGVRL